MDSDAKTVDLEKQLQTATTQSQTLGQTVRQNAAEKKRTNRNLDVVRRLVQLCAVVVIVLIIVLLIFTHKTLPHPHKYPAAAFFGIVCVAYVVALEIARGNFLVVLSLLIGGTATTFFALGYALAVLKQIAF